MLFRDSQGIREFGTSASGIIKVTVSNQVHGCLVREGCAILLYRHDFDERSARHPFSMIMRVWVGLLDDHIVPHAGGIGQAFDLLRLFASYAGSVPSVMATAAPAVTSATFAPVNSAGRSPTFRCRRSMRTKWRDPSSIA